MTDDASRRLPELAVDTIAALATAAGPGAIALVRMSGPEAFKILRALTPDHGDPAPRMATLQSITKSEGGDLLDRALVTAFPRPDSYTGEDLVEISCHGGWLVPRLILEACVATGARLAEPGEFTRRAVLHGKMDLVQAEAVLDLIEGRSKAQHDAALFQVERGLSRRIAELREQLVTVEAYLAHHIDFPEEDEAPVSVDRVVDAASALREALEELLETAPEGELLREGALTVLAGPPNSGKSSLYNALLGEERAIVTEVPGTTRDALEAVISIGGFPFRLVDTAGLRDSDDRVEELGIEVARRYLDRADLVLFCVEIPCGSRVGRARVPSRAGGRADGSTQDQSRPGVGGSSVQGSGGWRSRGCRQCARECGPVGGRRDRAGTPSGDSSGAGLWGARSDGCVCARVNPSSAVRGGPEGS